MAEKTAKQLIPELGTKHPSENQAQALFSVSNENSRKASYIKSEGDLGAANGTSDSLSDPATIATLRDSHSI
jgi:hypothetical protein